MKKSFFIFIGILLIPLCTKAFDDFYIKIYEEIKKSKYETPLDRSSTQLGISSDELLGVLNSTENLKKICNQLDQSDLSACYFETEQLFRFEKAVAEIEATEKINAMATEIWMNGTLADSPFDVVVDLNIIDVIYFGKEARIPSSREFNLLFDKDKKKDHDKPEEEETEDEDGEEEEETEDEDGEEEEETEDEDGEEEEETEDEDGEEEEDYSEFVCRDPDALFIDSTISDLEKDRLVSPDSSDSKNTSKKSSTKTSLRPGLISGADNRYLGTNYPTFEDENSDGSENACDGDEVEMFGNMFCVPRFCDSVLCIEIEFIAGRIPNRSPNEDCIKCLIDYAAYDIEESYKVKDRLNPESHSTKHFWSRIWPLGSANLHFNVFEKPPGVAERITRDKDMTLVEEYRYAIAKSIQPGSAAFVASDGNVKNYVKSKDVLKSIIGNNCDTYLNNQTGKPEIKDLSEKCKKNLEDSQSYLIQGSEKIREFVVKYSEDKKQERKVHRWDEVIKPGFNNLAGQIEAVNNVLRELPKKEQFNTIENNNCRNR